VYVSTRVAVSVIVLVTVVVFTAVMVCVMRMGTCLVTVSTLTKPTLGAEKIPPAKPIKNIVIDTTISSTKPFESLKIFTSEEIGSFISRYLRWGKKRGGRDKKYFCFRLRASDP
jgi:hypothetical protein